MKLYSFKTGMKSERKKAGYTQQTFVEAYNAYCKKTGSDCTTTLESVRNWEQGRSVPEWETVTNICNMFGCDMDALFGNISRSTHDLEYICSETGLDETSVERLQYYKGHSTGKTGLVNFLLHSANFDNLLFHLDEYFTAYHLLYNSRKIRQEMINKAMAGYEAGEPFNPPSGDSLINQQINEQENRHAVQRLSVNDNFGFIIKEMEKIARKKGTV